MTSNFIEEYIWNNNDHCEHDWAAGTTEVLENAYGEGWHKAIWMATCRGSDCNAVIKQVWKTDIIYRVGNE